jgi:hypothetical protein
MPPVVQRRQLAGGMCDLITQGCGLKDLNVGA